MEGLRPSPRKTSRLYADSGASQPSLKEFVEGLMPASDVAAGPVGPGEHLVGPVVGRLPDGARQDPLCLVDPSMPGVAPAQGTEQRRGVAGHPLPLGEAGL